MNAMATPTFLVVDDDEYSLELALITLGKLGFTQVQAARDGNEGLRAMVAMERPPDLLICDIFMPNKDGIEFVGELVKLRYQGGVILVSGGDAQMLDMARQIAMQSGLKVLGAFAKPLLQDVLREAIAVFSDSGMSRHEPERGGS